MDSAGEGERNFFEAPLELMTVVALVCGPERLSGFQRRGLRTWKKDVADLTGIEDDGVEGDGVEGDGVEDDGVEGDGVEDDGIEGDGVEDAGIEDARDGRNQ